MTETAEKNDNVSNDSASDALKIMIIDDDKVSSKLNANTFSKRGFKVSQFFSANKALEELPYLEPDIVLMDWVMPEVSGIQALSMIRKNYTQFELPVIMLTSMDKPKDIAEALGAGANDYLTKPMQKDVALARVHTQVQLQLLHREKVKREQLEALSALIVTYNHEINNPLTVAYGAISRLQSTGDMSYLDKLKTSIEKIADINKKIRNISGQHFKTVEYANGRSMIDWEKKED